MARRYIGEAVIDINYRDQVDYAGTISAGGYTWHFDGLRPSRSGFGRGVAYDSPKAYDEMAASAVSFGAYYRSYNRGDDVPEWAPPAEVADAIDDATAGWMDERGTYEVLRQRPRQNPTRARKYIYKLALIDAGEGWTDEYGTASDYDKLVQKATRWVAKSRFNKAILFNKETGAQENFARDK